MQYIYNKAIIAADEMGVIRHVGDALNVLCDAWDDLSRGYERFYDDEKHYLPSVAMRMDDSRDSLAQAIDQMVKTAESLGWKPLYDGFCYYRVIALVKDGLDIDY